MLERDGYFGRKEDERVTTVTCTYYWDNGANMGTYSGVVSVVGDNPTSIGYYLRNFGLLPHVGWWNYSFEISVDGETAVIPAETIPIQFRMAHSD